MKVYIIGPVGSGKTTLAEKLANSSNIDYYELDSVIWKHTISGDVKRESGEVEKIFNKILINDNWIIEDVGREVFKQGIVMADVVIYLDINKYILKSRIIKRWRKQRLKLVKVSYVADYKMLKQMFKWCNNGVKKKDNYILELKEMSNKLIILNNKQLKTFCIDDLK